MTGTSERRGPLRVAPVLLTVLCALALAALAAPRAEAARHDRRCTPAGIDALHGSTRVERQVRCLLNARRARAGLRPLRYERCLDRSAERHARDMVRRRYFAHSSSRGRTLAQRARAAGYVPRVGSWRLGENLAWGGGGRSTARAAVRGWMTSPPHRANVLDGGFRDVGVAVVWGAPVARKQARSSGAPTATFVVEFGARRGRACGQRAAGNRTPAAKRKPAAKQRRHRTGGTGRRAERPVRRPRR